MKQKHGFSIIKPVVRTCLLATVNKVNQTHIIKLPEHTVHLELGSVTVINAGAFCFFIVCFIHFLQRGKEKEGEMPNTHHVGI